MVKIRIDVAKLELKIAGHAEADEPGKDLVCCAVSILADTLSRYLETLKEAKDLCKLTEEFQHGYVYIKAKPWGWKGMRAWTAFEITREGLRAIAEEYPQYVTMEEA